MTEKRKILLVEDDATLGFLLQEYLTKNFEVHWVENGSEALALLKSEVFDLAILDVMMPQMDGFSLARELNALAVDIPFVFLTARSLKEDALQGLQLGAYDYIRKPIDEEELLLKITTILSHFTKKVDSKKQDTIPIGAYIFYPKNQELVYNVTNQKLTKRESDVLQMLCNTKNSICSHKEILEKLWGEDDYFTRQSLNVFITRLRKYLSKDPAITLENIHNQGFILRP